MARFLLIHGSCHGAWCWEATIAELRARGHDATAIDLPGHGTDKTPPEEVTLDDYARAICAAINDPVLLVGHSMAGYAIAAAAERCPDKVAGLIYLAAYVPMAGKSLVDMRRMAPTQPLLEAIRVSPDRLTWSADPDMAVDKFYADVPPDLARATIARLTPEPIVPQETPLWPDHAETLPRDYIRCAEDFAVPTAFQHIMTEGWPEGTVHDLPGSHSPFLSRPSDLAATLDRIAARRPTQ